MDLLPFSQHSPAANDGRGPDEPDHRAPPAERTTVGPRVRDLTATVLYVLLLAAVVVGVDVLFFRHQFLERLIVNIGIVLVFAALYLRFLKRP